MIVIDKLVVSNKEPENKYVIWYSPVTKETYRWFKDGWEKISVDSCKILEAIETVKDVVIETHETVLNLESLFTECAEMEIENMFPNTYTVKDNISLGAIDTNNPTLQQLKNSLLLYGLTINYK